MPEILPETPYGWLTCGKKAVSEAIIALNAASNRMVTLNPIENLEEMAYLRKVREALQKAIKETAFIERIPY